MASSLLKLVLDPLHQLKRIVKVGPPLIKFSGSAHGKEAFCLLMYGNITASDETQHLSHSSK